MLIIGIDQLLPELRKRYYEKLAIIGAGVHGRGLAKSLGENSIEVNLFLDNDKKKQGKIIDNIPVKEIMNLGSEGGKNNWIYIITIENSVVRNRLFQQLLDNHVVENEIVTFCPVKEYEYYREAYLAGRCKEELSAAYRAIFSRELNWEHPTRYTEILNVEKLKLSDPLRTKLADKVEVRKWIKNKIGEKYLVKRYFEWSNIDDIDFNLLPDQYVLKLNNGSGRNIIVKDKNILDVEEAKNNLKIWFEQNYAFVGGCYEFQYKDIVPKVVCEEYLEGVAETVYDYNIYCFHGEPKYIWCIKGSHRAECQASFYDTNWNIQPFSFGYPKDPIIAPRPEKLDEMLELSKILCQDFQHIRVDWYNLPDGRVLFGEMTLTSWSGLQRFVPDEYDEFFGKLILQG